jgi:hypothetical protein
MLATKIPTVTQSSVCRGRQTVMSRIAHILLHVTHVQNVRIRQQQLPPGLEIPWAARKPDSFVTIVGPGAF